MHSASRLHASYVAAFIKIISMDFILLLGVSADLVASDASRLMQVARLGRHDA